MDSRPPEPESLVHEKPESLASSTRTLFGLQSLVTSLWEKIKYIKT